MSDLALFVVIPSDVCLPIMGALSILLSAYTGVSQSLLAGNDFQHLLCKITYVF